MICFRGHSRQEINKLNEKSHCSEQFTKPEQFAKSWYLNGLIDRISFSRYSDIHLGIICFLVTQYWYVAHYKPICVNNAKNNQYLIRVKKV